MRSRLEWDLNYLTSSYEALFKTYYEDQGVIHPYLAKKPAPCADDDVYYGGFCILGARRFWNQVGPQPLQVSEIVAYMDVLGITNQDERNFFLRIVTHLDHVELKHHSEKRK